MLRDANTARCSTGLCRAGSPPLPSRASVRAWGVASGSGARVGCDADDGVSVASRLDGRGPQGVERGRAGGAEAPIGRTATRRAGCGTAAGCPEPRIPDRSVDPASGRDGDPAPDGRAVSPGPRLVSPAAAELVTAAAGAAGARTRRAGYSPVGGAAVARGKKNARRQRAWLVFEDESGLSTQPVVRRTWAPRGETPVLTHRFRHWERVSVAAALAFRWDGRRSRVFFQTRSGPYTAASLIGFLRQLKRHFRRGRVILLWDGLPAHRSGRMREYLTQQRHWLSVERLPAYAPELNPAEPLFGNVKGVELANRCGDLPDLCTALRHGMARVRRRRDLAFAFLRHAGLNL